MLDFNLFLVPFESDYYMYLSEEKKIPCENQSMANPKKENRNWAISLSLFPLSNEKKIVKHAVWGKTWLIWTHNKTTLNLFRFFLFTPQLFIHKFFFYLWKLNSLWWFYNDVLFTTSEFVELSLLFLLSWSLSSLSKKQWKDAMKKKYRENNLHI